MDETNAAFCNIAVVEIQVSVRTITYYSLL
jgi:hypothetical protein